jgi:hypothetical protein
MPQEEVPQLFTRLVCDFLCANGLMKKVDSFALVD